MGIAKVARIIAKRDGLDYDEALPIVENVINDINDMLDGENWVYGSLESVETIFMEELGLEPDYLFDIIF